MQKTVPLARPREFDYIEKDWLEKLTTGSCHDWDIYIVKELVDNALDADEEHGFVPSISVQIVLESDALEIRVDNLAPFPQQYIERFFKPDEYVSVKHYFNYPTRGAQGNALKTILGIPYALRYLFFGNYESLYRPLVITTEDSEFTVRYKIDEINRSITPDIEKRRRLLSSQKGTRVFVGIDRFRQQRRRTAQEFEILALNYSLWNPHASFVWDLRIQGEKQHLTFPGIPESRSKFTGPAPVTWYDYGQFRQIVFAFLGADGPDYLLDSFLGYFAGYQEANKRKELLWDLGEVAHKRIVRLGDLGLQDKDEHLTRDCLFPLMTKNSPSMPPTTLGAIGQDHIERTLRTAFPILDPILYRRVESDERPSVPYVLELALAQVDLRRGPRGGRRIWFGINHSPAYQDPFFLKRFLVPDRPDNETILGLDGFLDAHGLDGDSPIILVAHLNCPNISYQTYGKSEIDDEPFNANVTRSLHSIITEYQGSRREIELDVRSAVFDALPEVVSEVSSDYSRLFSLNQLIIHLKQHVAKRDQTYAAWVVRPDASPRLTSIIDSYDREQGPIRGLLRAHVGHLTLPRHPDDHINLALTQIHSVASVVRQHSADKVLVVMNPEMENLLVANGFHNRFDAAILRSDGDFSAAMSGLVTRLGSDVSLPILLLHDASMEGCSLAVRLQRELLEKVQVRLVDVGLTPSQGQSLGMWTEHTNMSGQYRDLLSTAGLGSQEIAFLVEEKRSIVLDAFTPDGLTRWLETRLVELGLPTKALPPEEALAQQMLRVLAEKIGWRIESRFNEVAGLGLLKDRFILQLKNQDRLTNRDSLALVRQCLASSPEISWEQAVERVTDDLAEQVFMGSLDEDIQIRIMQHWQGKGL